MAVNEHDEGRADRRPYRKIERARQEEATRTRIVEAALRSYESQGPRATTVTAIAEQAGVSRMTVYNHFPIDAELFEACFDAWSSRHPRPKEGTWAGLEDPDARFGVALAGLYDWYSDGAPMIAHLLRDAPALPALNELMRERWWSPVDRMIDALSSGKIGGDEQNTRLRAAMRVALDFSTWASLTSAGLSDRQAAEIATGFVIMTDALAAAR